MFKFKFCVHFQTLTSLLCAACIPSAVATVYNWVLLFLAFTEDTLESLMIVRDDIGRNKVFNGSFIIFTVIWGAGVLLATHNWVSR